MNGGIQGDQEFLDTHVVIPRAEVERLREERDRLREEEIVAHAYLARLHRIEEAARELLHNNRSSVDQRGLTSIRTENLTALRAALEET